MLIFELLNKDITEDVDARSNVELQQAVDDIVLMLRKKNIKRVGINDIAGELGKTVYSDIYLNPTDPEFITTLIDVLNNNEWVDNVSADTVNFRQGSDMSSEEPAGEEAEQEADRQREKMQKMASSNLKKDDDNGGDL